MSHINLINKEKLPLHIAVIMDGNGRWAKLRGRQRPYGHRNGASSVRLIVEAAVEIGLKYLTLYSFSTENWKRPEAEVKALMSLLVSFIDAEVENLNNHNIQLQVIGNTKLLPITCQKKLYYAVNSTSSNNGMTLILAISYGGRQDITNATQRVVLDIKQRLLSLSDLSEDIFQKYLSTGNTPYPELLIRTGGEYRLSNFFLWEIAYTELYFSETLWPDFNKESFYEAIVDYQHRERRFGITSEQLQK
jgi:undecaprenyl diphosphate synthase